MANFVISRDAKQKETLFGQFIPFGAIFRSDLATKLTFQRTTLRLKVINTQSMSLSSGLTYFACPKLVTVSSHFERFVHRYACA